jgi:alpha-beta hydrolase superfamily lysophospholipase
MGTDGGFYALSDDQLQRLLAGQLAYASFLQRAGTEQPRETHAEALAVWYELSQVLQDEAACGAAQTDAIPAMAGYSTSAQVQATWAKLAKLADAEIRTRCETALMEATPDQVVQAVQGLKAFYERAAANKDAVLFRVA